MVVPYKDQDGTKKEQVAQMFDNISGKYDFLNHFLSAGVDIYWRKKALKMLAANKPKFILDVATGTADLAIQAIKTLNPDKIIGVDISAGMLDVGRVKLKEKGLDSLIELHLGDSEALNFKSDTFDAVMVSFGVRNFENLQIGLNDIYRVLKPGGQLMVLEFSKPTAFPIKQFYNFYSKYILPTIGKSVSSDSSAYTYLPESVNQFPDGEKFIAYCTKAGFENAKFVPFTFGICTAYLLTK